MPSVSNRQALAMAAARSGNSNIGIPQSVGREFNKADAKSGRLSKAARGRVRARREQRRNNPKSTGRSLRGEIRNSIAVLRKRRERRNG